MLPHLRCGRQLAWFAAICADFGWQGARDCWTGRVEVGTACKMMTVNGMAMQQFSLYGICACFRAGCALELLSQVEIASWLQSSQCCNGLTTPMLQCRGHQVTVYKHPLAQGRCDICGQHLLIFCGGTD